MSNEARNAEIIERRKRGEWPSEIRRAMGLSRNVVAGALNRAGLCDPDVDRTIAPVGNRKLTKEQVLEARALYKRGVRGSGFMALGQKYEVDTKVIRDAILGNTHKFRDAPCP